MIVFCTRGSSISYGPAWAHVSNTPFRWFKQYTHEGGIATPLICYWPRGIRRPGRITHQPGHVIDIMATCLDLAGAGYPQAFKGHELTPLEGKSLAPIFRGEQREQHRSLYWEHMGNLAVRLGKWKLVGNRHDRKWNLYDVEADRTELDDLAADMPEKTAQLGQLWLDWAERVGAMRGFAASDR